MKNLFQLSTLSVDKIKEILNLAIEFKVSDNVTNYDDIMDYYVTGDSAPIGRLSFSYGK